MFTKNQVLAGIGVFFSLVTAANAADYKFIVPHSTNPDGYNHQSLLVFKNSVENRSNGRISVEIYPSGQLCGNVRECVAGVSSGMFDYFPTTVSEMASYWQPAEAFDLPYLLPNDKVAECVYENKQFIKDVGDNFIQHAKGVRLMMVANSGGWRSFATTKKQIKTPADVKSLKIRTVPAPIQQNLVDAFGGSPTPITWPETYTALSTGVVDGTKNGIVDIIQNKLEESVKYLVLDEHAYMGGAWIMNSNKFNSLPDDLKIVVLDAIDAQQQYLMSYPKHNEYSAYEAFRKAKGVIYNPTPAEKEQFIATAKTVTDDWMKNANPESLKWYERFTSEINKCEAKVDSEYEYFLKK